MLQNTLEYMKTGAYLVEVALAAIVFIRVFRNMMYDIKEDWSH